MHFERENLKWEGENVRWFVGKSLQTIYHYMHILCKCILNDINIDVGLTSWPRDLFEYWLYHDVTSARSCNKVGHLFWFTILAQHETNDVILYIHSVHKHRGNSFQRQNYKIRLKQRSLNWINSMQVKKILFTNVFFSWSLCLLNMF